MNRRGLTLVETMVSICLFFLVVILVFNLYPGSLVSLRKGEQRTRADRVAQTALNQARNQAFSSLPLNTVTTNSTQYDNVTYSWNTSVEPIPGASPEMVRCVKVAVYWTERDAPRTSEHEVWVSNVTR